LDLLRDGDRLVKQLLGSGEMKVEQPNKHECLLLRHWYSTRGTGMILVEQTVRKVSKEVRAKWPGTFNSGEVRTEVVLAFANAPLPTQAFRRHKRSKQLSPEEFLEKLLARKGVT
jgi:hypothetical protein